MTRLERHADTPPERLLKATEIAEILNISRAYAYQLMQRGEIRTVQIGAARRVRPRDLRAYIEENVYPPIELPLRYVIGSAGKDLSVKQADRQINPVNRRKKPGV